MSSKYPFSAYDKKYLCLNMSTGMWLVLAFLLRPYVIMIMSLANRRDRMGLINMFYADRFGMVLGALAAVPALLLIYAWFKRKPDAPDRVRWLWRHGRVLLIASIVLNIVIVFVPVLLGKAAGIGYVGALQLALCAGILLYLLRSQRVEDTFADFPQPAA